MITNVVAIQSGGFMLTDSDGNVLFVPDDFSNRHRRDIAAWVRAGNTIDPPPPVVVEPPVTTRVEHLRDALLAKGVLVVADLPDEIKPRT